MDGSWARTEDYAYDRGCCGSFICRLSSGERFAPLVLALFIMAIIWPLQHRLQLHMPKLVALAITTIITIVVGLAFASLAVWAFGRVGRSFVTDAGRYQALYGNLVRGSKVMASRSLACSPNISMSGGCCARHRNHRPHQHHVELLAYRARLRVARASGSRRHPPQNRSAIKSHRGARLLDGVAASAIKFRKYLLVRTQMSVVTGLLVGAFAWIAGLQFAAEWV